MVLCASDVDTLWEGPDDPSATPTLPKAGSPEAKGIAYLTTANWTALAQLRCDDLYVCKGDNCYYGLILECAADNGPFKAGDYLVAVRGTMKALEWANDATAEIPVMAPGSPGQVGAGFWEVYQSMGVFDMAGASLDTDAARGIAALIAKRPAPVVVTGHSLGAALATYLTADLQPKVAALGVDFRPYFFASPKVGTQDYADHYQQTVPVYSLVNFAADLVPMLPSSPPFVALNGGGPTHDVHTIARGVPGAPPWPEVNPEKNHNCAYYALMLDPANTEAPRLLP
jgi:pimeloyl-ACP methyl ester carboxylesterase